MGRQSAAAPLLSGELPHCLERARRVRFHVALLGDDMPQYAACIEDEGHASCRRRLAGRPPDAERRDRLVLRPVREDRELERVLFAEDTLVAQVSALMPATRAPRAFSSPWRC